MLNVSFQLSKFVPTCVESLENREHQTVVLKKLGSILRQLGTSELPPPVVQKIGCLTRSTDKQVQRAALAVVAELFQTVRTSFITDIYRSRLVENKAEL